MKLTLLLLGLAVAACQSDEAKCQEVYQRTRTIYFPNLTGGQRSLLPTSLQKDMDSPELRTRYVAECVTWNRARRDCMTNVKTLDDIERCATYK